MKPHLSPRQAHEKLATGAVMIDIRSFDEYQREHIPQAIHCHVETLKNAGLPQEAKDAKEVIFHCFAGHRTQEAIALLETVSKGKTFFIVENGLQAWKTAGLNTVFNPKQVLPLMQQVQIVAGSLSLLGALGAYFLDDRFSLLPIGVGIGMIFAGLTGSCGMAKLLAYMPWNKQ